MNLEFAVVVLAILALVAMSRDKDRAVYHAFAALIEGFKSLTFPLIQSKEKVEQVAELERDNGSG